MFNDDATVVLDAGGGRPQSSAQVTCTSMSVRLAPRHDRHSSVKRRTAWQTAQTDDDEGRRRSRTLTTLSLTSVDDRSPPPSSAYRSAFNGMGEMCTLIVARATSDNQDNDDDGDEDNDEDDDRNRAS